MKKENIFKKFIKIIKNIFKKENETKYITEGTSENLKDTKKTFKSNLQEFNKSEKLIEKVSNNTSILYNMSLVELKELNKAIQKKQENLNQNIKELKIQIASFN